MYNDPYVVISAMLSVSSVCQCKYGQRGCAGRAGSARGGAARDKRRPRRPRSCACAADRRTVSCRAERGIVILPTVEM